MLPTGTVTFLFTDLEDSTRLWERDPKAMRAAFARHDELLRTCVERHDGIVVKSTGDGFMVAFADASQAVTAAIEGQRAIGAETWSVPIAVRMGLHSGAAEPIDGDYHAPAVNRAARVAGAAHAGQIVVSAATAALADGCEFRNLGEHRLKGLPTIGLLQVLAVGLRSEFPSLASALSAGIRIPSPLTSFIGREAEVDEVCRLVVEQGLVTLTGVGGCGKTRLAIEVASRLAARFADGTCFVDMAPISDEALVVDAIGAALGLTRDMTGDPFERLVGYVASRAMLIVLDNCEHLLDGIAAFAEAVALQLGAGRILATSREPLAVEGEQIHSVRSLVVETEAVRLFAERAGLLRKDFSVGDVNRAVVVEICRRLDGIPLAIELAAAQVSHLSIEQILERLNDRFRLLVGGRRRVQRQQTLLATLDWSHAMLATAEQVALRRLAVFPASFSLEAAQAVVDEEDVLRCLASLVTKSLVDVVDVDERFRYRLLETVRMYAEQQLVDAGEADQVRERHRDAVLASIEAIPLDRRWFGANDVLIDELPNVRAALEWSAARADGVALARIASGVDWTRGEYRLEGLGWCERAAEHRELPLPIRQQLLTMLAVLATTGLHEQGAHWTKQAVDIAEQEPSCFLAVSLAWQSAIQSVRAAAAIDEQLADAAIEAAERAVVMSDAYSAPWQIYCRFVAGMAHASLATSTLGDLARAKELYCAAASISPGPDFGALRAIPFEYLSLFELLEGNPRESLSIAERAPSGDGHWPMFGTNRSSVRMLALAATGDVDTSCQELRKLHDAFRRADVTRGGETVCMYAGALAAIAGDWDRAARLLAAGRLGIQAGAEAALVYYHYRDLVRAALSAPRARQLRDMGIAMSLEDAIDVALRS